MTTLENKSPESIALILFSDDPKPENSIQLELENTDPTFIFEILITILMEGIQKKYGDLKKINYDTFNENLLLNLIPYFKSIGFNINIKKYDKKNKEDYKDYYCKVILNDSMWDQFFEMKKIEKDYHFFINPSFVYNNNFNELKQVRSIFIVKDTVYNINFNYLYH